MKTNVEKLEDSKVKLTIEIEESELQGPIEAAYKTISRQVNIPGFRPGKAPRRLVEQRIGAESARAQALHDSIPDFYMRALEDAEVDAISTPTIDITEGEKDGDVIFVAEVEIRPQPNLAGYQGLEVEVPNPVPSEQDIDDHIERMRAQSGELEQVERESQAGDFLTIDISGTTEGEPVPGLTATDYSHEIGGDMSSLGQDFDDHLLMKKAGDELEFRTSVPPNDTEVDFKVTVKSVNERKLPEVSDEWANEVSEFETVKELREDIANRMQVARKAEANRSLRNGAIEALTNLVDDEVPETLIGQEMQRQLQDFGYRLQSQGIELAQYLAATGQDQESFVESLRENSITGVKADLALRSLAVKESLTASDEEVDDEVEALAGQYGQKVAKLRRQLEKAEQIPAIRWDIRKAKAVRWLVDNVEVVDSEGNKVDREALRFEQPSSGHGDHEGHDHDHADGKSDEKSDDGDHDHDH